MDQPSDPTPPNMKLLRLVGLIGILRAGMFIVPVAVAFRGRIIHGPIDDAATSDDIVHRREPPEAGVLRVIAVIAHHPEVIALDLILRGCLSIDHYLSRFIYVCR